jgi:hypothetical protein
MRIQSQSRRRNRVSHCGKGESSTLIGRMANDQGSSKPWHSKTSKLHEEVLMGYQHALYQQKNQLLREKSEIRRRHKSASVASRILREERSNASHTGGGRHGAPECNREDAEHGNRENCLQNLDSSFLSIDERGEYHTKDTRGSLGGSSSLPPNHTTSAR